MMRNLFGLTLLLFLTMPGRAQVNTEKMRSLEADGFGTTLSGTFALRTGNAEVIEVGTAARLDYRAGIHYAFFVGHIDYGKTSGEEFRNRAFGHLRYNYSTSSRIVSEVFGQVERDGFTLLQFRFLSGVGPRFRYLNTEHIGLFQGSTLMFEHEDLESEKVGTHPAIVNVLRWSNYINVRLQLSEHTSFVNTVYVQPRFDTFGDLRILDDATLELGITKYISYRTTFNLRYDSRPPGTLDPLDLSIRNGLVLTF